MWHWHYNILSQLTAIPSFFIEQVWTGRKRISWKVYLVTMRCKSLVFKRLNSKLHVWPPLQKFSFKSLSSMRTRINALTLKTSILMTFFHLILKRFYLFGVLRQYNLPKVSGAVGAMWLHFIVCSKISKRSSKVDTLKMSFTFCPAVPSTLTSKIKTKSIKVLMETENYISLTSFLNMYKTFQ